MTEQAEIQAWSDFLLGYRVRTYRRGEIFAQHVGIADTALNGIRGGWLYLRRYLLGNLVYRQVVVEIPEDKTIVPSWQTYKRYWRREFEKEDER